MGGVDKGLAPFRGKPMVAHVIERLAPQVDELLVNANRNPEAYAGFGHRVIAAEPRHGETPVHRSSPQGSRTWQRRVERPPLGNPEEAQLFPRRGSVSFSRSFARTSLTGLVKTERQPKGF